LGRNATRTDAVGAVAVDDVRDGVDELDDELRHAVARGRLRAEEERARLPRLAALGAEVERHDVERVEELALVLVQALDLHVEDRRRVDLEAHELARTSFARCSLFVRFTARSARGTGVVGVRLERRQPGDR
jgi:hypothetical protein